MAGGLDGGGGGTDCPWRLLATDANRSASDIAEGNAGKLGCDG